MEEHAANPRGGDAVSAVLYYENGFPVRIPEDRAKNGDTGLRFADSCLRTDGNFNSDYIKKWIADNYITETYLIEREKGGSRSKSFLISAEKQK